MQKVIIIKKEIKPKTKAKSKTKIKLKKTENKIKKETHHGPKLPLKKRFLTKIRSEED